MAHAACAYVSGQNERSSDCHSKNRLFSTVGHTSSFSPRLPVCLSALGARDPRRPACPHKSPEHGFNSVNLKLGAMWRTWRRLRRLLSAK